jgi:hypothetical protein
MELRSLYEHLQARIPELIDKLTSSDAVQRRWIHR